MGKGQPSVNLKCDPERAEELHTPNTMTFSLVFHMVKPLGLIAVNEQFRMRLSKLIIIPMVFKV
jgi:hypothetical protein